jgi:FkbM family methyltransferase
MGSEPVALAEPHEYLQLIEMNDYRLWLDARVPLQADAMARRAYEPQIVDACCRLLPAEGVCLDLGANIGLFTCPLGLRVREGGGRVYAFEPVPGNVRHLRWNLAENGLEPVVTVVETALGVEPGEMTIYIEPQGESNNAVGGNMLAPHDRANIEQNAWPAVNVPVARLDDWAAGAGLTRCDLIKIDVEGAELLVFRGAPRFLERFRPVIVGEFNPYWMQQIGQSFETAMDFFRPLDYLFYREIDGVYQPVTEENKVRDLLQIPNYLLLPRERAELRERLNSAQN